MKKISLFSLVAILFFVFFITPTKVEAAEEIVTIRFTDTNLYMGVKSQIISKVSTANDSNRIITITRSNLMTIRSIILPNKNISSLNGLEQFTNLSVLILEGNQITNIFPLRTLTNLVTLNLNNNKISNLSYLAPLTNLTNLYLKDNVISDIAVLEKLTKLKNVYLSNNAITDITSLSFLPNLSVIVLDGNRVKDVTPLRELTNLTTINLKNQTYEYSLTGNALSNIKTNINLPTFFIQAKQVGSPIYTASAFTVPAGVTIGANSTYITIQNSPAGKQTLTVKISGGNADGSILTLNYNSVLITVTNSTSSPNSIYEGEGGTITFSVTAAGETSMEQVSIQVMKNNSDVTQQFGITQISKAANSNEVRLRVSDQIEAGTYYIHVNYNNKTAVRGSFTIHNLIRVTGVRLNITSLSLPINTSQILQATVLPTNALNQNIIWFSSDSSIVSVNANGQVTAKKYGTATITVTTEDGRKSASCVVTVPEPVTPPEPEIISVQSITLNKEALSLLTGLSEKLYATILPSNATNQAYSWLSTRPDVASVDETGMVTAHKAGSAKIIVNAQDNSAGTKQAICEVTVKEPEPEIIHPQSITLNKTTLSLVAGKAETLYATVLPANATNKEVTWSSSNVSIASIDNNGKVTAIAPGKAQIIVSSKDTTLGNIQAICEVTVTTNAITSSTYTVEGTIISRISANQNLQTILSHLSIPLAYKVYNAKGNELATNALVGTGTKIVLENNTNYTLVVTGDITGDGKITASDILSLKKHIVKVQLLSDIYEKAADVNNTSSVTATDLFRLKQAAVKLIEL